MHLYDKYLNKITKASKYPIQYKSYKPEQDVGESSLTLELLELLAKVAQDRSAAESSDMHVVARVDRWVELRTPGQTLSMLTDARMAPEYG